MNTSQSRENRVFRVQRFWTLFSVIVIAMTTITACGAPSAPVVATATPAPPAPEGFDGYPLSAAAAAVKSCDSMPVWLIYTNWRGLDVRVEMTSPDNVEFSTGELEATYVAFGQVFINDRLVEFATDGVNVFQLFEGKDTYELYPGPYISRAVEILEGDVAPVQIIATWRWVKDEDVDYEDWNWRVVDAKCSRLEAVVPPHTTREPHRPN